MAKKVKLTKGFGGRIISGVAAGAVNAAYDKFLSPMLPASIAKYGQYIKVGVGAILPELVKGNTLVNSAADGLMAIGASQIVSGLLGGNSTTTVGAVRPLYPNVIKKHTPSASKNMVGSPSAASSMVGATEGKSVVF